jgi:hypothetical protein
MEKAYDPKALVEKLKLRGLDLAEDAAKILVEEVSAWLVESSVLSATPYDDIVAVVMPIIKKTVLEQVDKIDGKIGE